MPRQSVVLRVVELWHDSILDERCYRKGAVVVGAGARADFITAGDLGLPPLFTLFKKGWKGWRATLAPGMTGELTVGGATRGVADVLHTEAPRKKKKGGEWRAVPLAAGDWGVVRLADHAFFFQITPPEAPIRAPVGAAPGTVRASSIYSFVLHALVVASTFLFATWPPPGATSLGGYVIQISQTTRRLPPPPPEKKPAGNAEGEKKDKPAATADKEGKAGGEGKKPRATQSSPKPNPNARDELVKKVQDAGVLKYRAEFARIAGPSQEDARLALAMARVGDRGFGGGHGTGVGPGAGTGTSTRGGSGAGGGGRSTSELITAGPIDTGARRGGRGTPGGVQVAEAKVPQFKSEAADASGGLTPEQVRAVVERHRSAIQWCFEKELQKNPKLSGKVVVFWQIEPTGTVSSSRIKSSAVADPDVDDCLQRQVVKWQFPSAANGQVTKVFYPFVFSSR
jgi:hypothetical protein